MGFVQRCSFFVASVVEKDLMGKYGFVLIQLICWFMGSSQVFLLVSSVIEVLYTSLSRFSDA